MLWRHQKACQWRHPKNFRKVSLPNGSKNGHFNHFSDISVDKCRVYLHSFSQDSVGRSGNWHKVIFFARSHLKSYYWNSIFLVSHHSAWSYWEFIYFVFVYRLMNHVARPKIFFCIILLINLFWNHQILSELCTSFQRAHYKDFKNIYLIEIERPYRKLSYFFDLSGQNDQFRPRN